MNVKHISVKKQKGKTNWDAVKLMTDAEIESNAKLDPDAFPSTTDELKQFKRVNPTQEVDVKLIRQKLNMSQDAFAGYFGVSVRTLQEWEQHRRRPTLTARNFLKVIAFAPQTVFKALQSH